MSTDDQIREKIFERMVEKGIRQAEIARKLDVSPQAVGQILNGQKAKAPQSLLDILEVLDLELTVTPKVPKPDDG